MKRFALILGLIFLFSSQTQAEGGDHYYLLNVGYSWIDNSADPDPLILGSLSYGYRLSQRWALEIDYTQSLSGGSYEIDDGGTTREGDYSFWALSASAAYRHLFAEAFFFKGKIGLSYGEEEITSSLDKTESEDITDPALAVGIGYLAGPMLGSSLTLEVTLARQAEDLTSIMIGANATF